MWRSLTSIRITDFLSQWKRIIISPHTKCHIPLFGSLNLHSGECWHSGFGAVRCNKLTKTTHHDTHRKLPNAIQLKSHNCINGNFTMKIWFPGKLTNSEMTTQANPQQRQKMQPEKNPTHILLDEAVNYFMRGRVLLNKLTRLLHNVLLQN